MNTLLPIDICVSLQAIFDFADSMQAIASRSQIIPSLSYLELGEETPFDYRRAINQVI